MQPACAWLLEITFFSCSMCVCVCVCVCVCAPEAINYIHMISNLYIKLSKFTTFQNVTIYGHGFSNKACCERNQPNTLW